MRQYLPGFGGLVDRCLTRVENGKCYEISRCSIQKAASPRLQKFSSINNYHELLLEEYSLIMPCELFNPSFKIRYSDILHLNECNHQYVNILGIVIQVEDAQLHCVQNTGAQRPRQNVKVVDRSGANIWLVLSRVIP